jgi:hypothetical protein
MVLNTMITGEYEPNYYKFGYILSKSMSLENKDIVVVEEKSMKSMFDS